MKQFYIDNNIDYDGNELYNDNTFSEKDYYQSIEKDFKNFLESVEGFLEGRSTDTFILAVGKIYKDRYFK